MGAEFLMLCCDVWTMWGIHHDDLSSHYPVTSHSPPHSRVPTTPQPPHRETQQPLNYDNNVTVANNIKQQRNFQWGKSEVYLPILNTFVWKIFEVEY